MDWGNDERYWNQNSGSQIKKVEENRSWYKHSSRLHFWKISISLDFQKPAWKEVYFVHYNWHTIGICRNHRKIYGKESERKRDGGIENLTNVERITKHFQFGLLNDPDDNKFVDCAIAANADYLVSHDKDFKTLKSIDFPKVNLVNIIEFHQIIMIL